MRRNVRRIKGRGFVEDEPKSQKSRRGLTLHPAAIGALERHRERRAFERKRTGDAWQDRGLVFANAVGGYVEAGNLKRNSYRPLLDRAGFPRSLGFHDLRHSTASIMIELGENLKAIQE